MLSVGSKGRAETVVSEHHTAKTVGSGSLEVFGTPMMLALMEKAAVAALQLSSNQTSVGVALDAKHIAATPVGMKTWAVAEVIEVTEKRIRFFIQAFDEIEKIGEATHDRVVVKIEQFMARTTGKLGGQ